MSFARRKIRNTLDVASDEHTRLRAIITKRNTEKAGHR